VAAVSRAVYKAVLQDKPTT